MDRIMGMTSNRRRSRTMDYDSGASAMRNAKEILDGIWENESFRATAFTWFPDREGNSSAADPSTGASVNQERATARRRDAGDGRGAA